MKNVVVGTAGHVDHGKTLLVKALTGTDADRWEEEKRRGITMDIGFAEMVLPALHLHFVDLPGHERFIKNMLAGATGIDLALIVIAADESVMPQTKEHVDILALLGIKRGVVALNKVDLVDEETLAFARVEVAEFLESRGMGNMRVIPVSARTGEGLPALIDALQQHALECPPPRTGRPFRLPVDRVFSVKGFGTVITGTCLDGRVAVGEMVELFPGARKTRVRGLQVFGKTVEDVTAGQRVAVNLQGLRREEVERGNMAGRPGALWPTRLLYAKLKVLESARQPIKTGSVSVLHVHTQEVEAHLHLNGAKALEAGEEGLVQIRTAVPVMAWPGDRFILRMPSPARTVAGGEVCFPAKRRARWLRPRGGAIAGALAGNDVLRALLLEAGPAGLLPEDISSRMGLTAEALSEIAADGVERGVLVLWGGGAWWLEASEAEGWMERALLWLKGRTEGGALLSWVAKQELTVRWRRVLDGGRGAALIKALEKLGKIECKDDKLRPAGHRVTLNPAQKEAWAKAEMLLKKGVSPVMSGKELEAEVGKAVRTVLPLIVENGDILRFGGDFFMAAAVLERLRNNLSTWKAEKGEVITVPEFKELLAITRKYAVPLLEYLDDLRWTRRVEKGRVILVP